MCYHHLPLGKVEDELCHKFTRVEPNCLHNLWKQEENIAIAGAFDTSECVLRDQRV